MSDTLTFSHEGEGIILQCGLVQYCKNVMLEVEKWFETRHFGNTLRVRCQTYTYIGWLPAEHLLLKYHNLHQNPDEYHHRVYDPATGLEVFHEVLQRYQFLTFTEVLFTEVLDELQIIAERL